MTFQTDKIKLSLTDSWKRSLIELTNIFFGDFHRNGISRDFLSSLTVPFHIVLPFFFSVRPEYLSILMDSNLFAMLIA